MKYPVKLQASKFLYRFR